MYPENRTSVSGIFIKNIEDGLVTNGVVVDKIVIKGRGKKFIDKIKKYYFFYKEILHISFDEYDFVHLSYPSHTYFPIIFKNTNKTKLIVRLHGHDLLPINSFKKIALYFTKQSIRKADIVVVPSKYFYKELLKIAEPKNYYIYPSGGLDTKRFYPKENENTKKLTIGYVGRIAHGKGVDILLNAVAKLTFDFELIIVGGGDLKNEMKQKSTILNHNQIIIFVGKMSNDELVDYYNSFDIFVFPTLMHESFGNVAIEAMGCRVPVIGSKIGGLTDYIYDNINGYFFKSGDANDLALKITRFNNLSLDEKKCMSDKAYKIALKYEKNQVTNGFIRKLEGLM